MFHTTALLWKIQFPFHARSFETAHRVKYIHIGCVVAGFILPLVPVITSMVTFAVELESDEIRKSRNITFVSGGMGYGLNRFPPILCPGTNKNAVFYALALPINLMLMYGITVLIFLFYVIHKVSLQYIYIDNLPPLLMIHNAKKRGQVHVEVKFQLLCSCCNII